MAHDKAFLVCENKCFVEGLSKEQIEAGINLLNEKYSTITNCPITDAELIPSGGRWQYILPKLDGRWYYFKNNSTHSLHCYFPATMHGIIKKLNPSNNNFSIEYVSSPSFDLDLNDGILIQFNELKDPE